MARANARKVLENSNACREEISQAIYWLEMDLKYLFISQKNNPAQETQVDIRESRDLLEQLKFKLATL